MGEQEIVVLGATGSTGRRVAGQLRARGCPVRAASPGAPVRFDWFDPSSWPDVVRGARAAYVMAPDGVAVPPEFVEYVARAFPAGGR